ncbi:ABC transporter substrate-binding protein [Mycetocola zhadangensis]|uniref:Extracellular solute-binding protein n=1 Tax=Mycetocola zhadangensis TaxID=1164595 RepID=A0A3L7J120_9MICO|nr:extracellular solute-binding protein [Mycetocola zhadangensis]RLQ84079.1 extracellular solute-binding protein [Mycetocola zhadangensis]GGE96353.1 sugar ABC transporter substrate-binding protein [Mycetocola zhadangensis]
MVQRQKVLIAATVTASVFILTGCGGGGSGETADVSFSDSPSGALSAWGFDNADDVGTSRLDYAEKQLSDVDIKIDQTAFDAQKFTTRVASGNVPDVVQMDRQFVGTYAAQGLITPLDECFAAHSVEPDDQYYESVMDDVEWDDKVWAVPQFYQPPAIILNKRVMDAAGVTADQIDTSKPDVLLDAIGKMYQESGGNPSVLGFDSVGVNQAGLWLLGYGGELMDDDGVPALDSPENAEAINFLKQLFDAQGGYAKYKSFTDSFDAFGDENPYVADQVGAQVNAQWYVNVLSPYADEIQIEAVPFRNIEGEPFAVTGGQAFVIPAGAKNADAACAWAVNLTSQDAWMAAGEARAKTIAAEPGAINTGLFTGSPEADEAIREKFVTTSGNAGFDQTIATFYDVVGEGESFGASAAGQEIQTELKNAVTSTLLGDKSAEDALADAQEAAMRAYDKVTK